MQDKWKETLKHVRLFRDPRAPELGYRLIADSSFEPGTTAQNSAKWKSSNLSEYMRWRYSHAIMEGSTEFRPGVMLPQESNLDWNHGIDYRKGCYVGQELVIRTHHKGVVRKRVLTVHLDGPLEALIQLKQQVMEGRSVDLQAEGDASAKRPAGKLVGIEGDMGLALVRLDGWQRLMRPVERSEISVRASWPSHFPTPESVQ